MGRVEMRDHDEDKTAVGRHRSEEFLERCKASRRGDDTYDRRQAARDIAIGVGRPVRFGRRRRIRRASP